MFVLLIYCTVCQLLINLILIQFFGDAYYAACCSSSENSLYTITSKLQHCAKNI